MGRPGSHMVAGVAGGKQGDTHGHNAIQQMGGREDVLEGRKLTMMTTGWPAKSEEVEGDRSVLN